MRTSIRKIFVSLCVFSLLFYMTLLFYYAKRFQNYIPPTEPHSAILAFTEENKRYWYGLDISTPPRYHPWMKWGSLDSTKSRGVDFEPLLEALVLIDASPPTDYDYDVLILRNGHVFRPQAKFDALSQLQPTGVTRFAVMQRSIQQALDHAKRYRHLQPRIKSLYDNELILLIWKGDDTFCASDHRILYDTPIQYLPTFQWCREVTCAYSWPIVNFHVFDVFWHMNPAEWVTVLSQQRAKYPFHNQTLKAFWRGTVTGNMEDWSVNNVRIQMARIANKHTNIMDVAFTGRDQIPQQDKHTFDQEFQLLPMIERVEQQQFVAIIDIDGNSWSSRLSNQLCLNSVTIKVEAHWEDYFYNELTPWVHYIPVHANLSNLVDVVQHVVDPKNSDQMQQIVRNANNWCQSKLTRMQMSVDMLWMLVSYAEALDRGDKQWRTKWRSNHTGYELPHLNMTRVDPNMMIPR